MSDLTRAQEAWEEAVFTVEMFPRDKAARAALNRARRALESAEQAEANA